MLSVTLTPFSTKSKWNAKLYSCFIALSLACCILWPQIRCAISPAHSLSSYFKKKQTHSSSNSTWLDVALSVVLPHLSGKPSFSQTVEPLLYFKPCLKTFFSPYPIINSLWTAICDIMYEGCYIKYKWYSIVLFLWESTHLEENSFNPSSNSFFLQYIIYCCIQAKNSAKVKCYRFHNIYLQVLW